MIGAQPIGLVNTALPVMVLGAAALYLPRLLAGHNHVSHRRVSVSVAISAVALVLFAGAIFAVIYQLSGVGVLGALAQAPLATLGFFARLSGLSAVIWVPVLALSWYVMAQGVEQRRGEHAASRGQP